MRVHVANHPLVSHKITLLRSVSTPSPQFRSLVEELVMLLGVEATADLRTVEATVTTPLTTTTTRMLATPDPLVVPILRAGLGLLDGMLRLLPSAEVGFLGLARDETTLQPSIYADRFPVDITGRQALVLDPMLATGGSLNAAISLLFDRGVESVTAMVLIAAPEGIAAVSESFGDRDVTLIIGALDEKLNEDGYIVPGLGDAGDRLYGGV
jgi:uracil phosphoribosyltransferase